MTTGQPLDQKLEAGAQAKPVGPQRDEVPAVLVFPAFRRNSQQLVNALVPYQIHEVGKRCAGKHGGVNSSGGSGRVPLSVTGGKQRRGRRMIYGDTVLQPPRAWFRFELVEKETCLIGIRSDNSCLISQSREGLRFYHLPYTTYGRGRRSRGCSSRLED